MPAERISIHALREEGDLRQRDGRATDYISIHALREEGDTSLSSSTPFSSNFYPRPPRGGRPVEVGGSLGAEQFLSTPSARRATWIVGTMATTTRFLSTPSARRATLSFSRSSARQRFLSTPSARRATFELRASIDNITYFYPRPPRGGRPPESDKIYVILSISIHALREEGDSKNRDKSSIFKQIIQHSARI